MKTSKNNPNHIAIIMDGNGTWSKRNKLQRKDGHKAGVKTAKRIIGYSLENNIKNVTLYALSNENLTRTMSMHSYQVPFLNGGEGEI